MSEILRILLVEDNPADSDLILDLLPASGPVRYQVESVTRLAAAITRLADKNTDLVLLDLGLPDSQGLVTFHQARKAAPDVAMIVLTGIDDDDLAVAAVREGAQDYLAKGQLSRSLLARAVRYAVERQKLEAVLWGSLREKESLLSEIHHRVKNNLQIISSLLHLQAGRNEHPVVKSVLLDMQNRVRSMALIHEHLYQTENFAAVDLAAYLTNLCHKLLGAMATTPGTIQLHLDLEPVWLGIEQAIPCGLLVNELVTNALKHAFPDGRYGELRVELRQLAGPAGWCLRVADNGVGLPPNLSPADRSALGLRLVNDLTGQLGGRLKIGAGPGAAFELTCPIRGGA